MVEVYDYKTGCDKPIALCLGFFDCLHLGHARIIECAMQTGGEIGAAPALFTFDTSLTDLPGKGEEGEIFTLEERLYRMDELGIHNAVVAKCDRAFFSLDPNTFLNTLTANFDIRAIICGEDYTYGNKGSGNVATLRKFCDSHGILFRSVALVSDDNGEKIASRKIRTLIKNGDMRAVNSYLPLPYIVMGTVVHGRHDGRKMGFPTANTNLPKDKLKPHMGVYYTNIVLDKKRYPCITNIGTHPTFNDYFINAETHIIGYEGDLYGKKIVVEFMDKIRDIIKFNSKEEIAEQLKKDVIFARENFENDKVRSQRNK